MTNSSERSLEFGLFFQVPVAPDQSEAARYADTIEQVVLGDKLGFQTAWLAEGHFLRPFSTLSAPLILAAALSQRTHRIRLGTAATLLPLHHPLRVAEEAATVDLLSGGRLDLGVSRGPAAFYGRAYGVPAEDYPKRFEEAVDVLRQAWAGTKVHHDGHHFQIEGVAVVPKPVQRPRPPIYFVTHGGDTLDLAASRGCSLLLAAPSLPFPGPLAGAATRFRAGQPSFPDGVVGKLGAVFFVHPSASLATSLKAMTATLEHYYAVTRGVQPALNAVASGSAVFGSAQDCRSRISAIREATGLDQLVCWFNPGGLLPHGEVCAAMELFASQILPAFRARQSLPERLETEVAA